MTKHKVPLTDVIAERSLSSINPKATLKISIYTPQLDTDGRTWGCPFKIELQEQSVVDFVWGADSLQTLQLVGLKIKLRIRENFSNIEFNENLEDSFPEYVPYYVDEEFRTKITELIESETKAWAKKLEEQNRDGLA